MSGLDAAAAAQQAQLLDLINAAWTTQAIAAACTLELPDCLAGRAQTAVELALTLQLDADALERLLQALVTLDVCHLQPDGLFALGPLGALLRRDHPQGLRHWALLNGGPAWTTWQGLAKRVRDGNSGAAGDRSAKRFAQLDGDPHEAALFHGAMSEMTRRLLSAVAALVTVHAGALIVDVGGGNGELLAGVLQQHPSARGLLLDLPHALDHAAPVVARHGVASRCEIRAGSFFDGVPAGGELYLLKSIVHDWDDTSAVHLLRRCREAMHGGARLLVIERVLPERLHTSPEHRALARADLNMLIGLAGRERRLAGFRALFEPAGLVLREVHPLRAGFSALEVVPGTA